MTTQTSAERKMAEQKYANNAFDYVSAPVGSRDWCMYWDGWKARAAMQTGEAVAVDGQSCMLVAEKILKLYFEPISGFDLKQTIAAAVRDAILDNPCAAPDRAPSTDSAAGWISVAERLPEEGADVVLIGPAFDDWKKRLYVSCAVFMGGVFYERDDGGEMHWPTWWMPVPDIAALQPKGTK